MNKTKLNKETASKEYKIGDSRRFLNKAALSEPSALCREKRTRGETGHEIRSFLLTA